MSRQRTLDEIITTFLLNTCRLRPQISKHALDAIAYCVEATTTQWKDEEAGLIPLTAGSVAEFYIEPMLPHVGDVDVMVHLSTQLAIPRVHPPPTQLPAEFSDYVQVFEIVDNHLPVKTRRPYNLYCVGADVKPCSVSQSPITYLATCT